MAFHSRRGCRISQLPGGVKSISWDAVVIGPVFRSWDVGMEEMSGYEEIREENFLRDEGTGEVVIQYGGFTWCSNH